MMFINTAGLLALLAMGSVVSALPAADASATVSTGLDMTVTFEDHMKQFKDVMGAEKRSDTWDSSPAAMEKRWTSSTCGGLGLNLLAIAAQAVELCNSAIRTLDNPTPYQRKRIVRYFGAVNDNEFNRGTIRARYRYIKETISNTNFNLICLPNQTNGNVIADVSSAGVQGSPANVRLFKVWFGLSNGNLCAEQHTKANVLVHEASHVFGSIDHNSDPAKDSYVLAWFASSQYGNCPF